jgi:hypothetical protein
MHMFIMWWIRQVVFVWSLYFLAHTCCILSFKSEYYCWNFPNDVLQAIGFPCRLIFFQLAAPNSCEGNWDANYRVDVGTSRVLVLDAIISLPVPEDISDSQIVCLVESYLNKIAYTVYILDEMLSCFSLKCIPISSVWSCTVLKYHIGGSTPSMY